MVYATQADLIERFGTEEITEVSGDGSGVLDSARVTRALADADAEIEASLAGRYTLPMQLIPPFLKRLACDLAREALYQGNVPKHVADRVEQVRITLMAIASGKMRFEIPESVGVPAPSAPIAARFTTGRPALKWPD